MKKIKLIALMAVASIALSGCTKEYITEDVTHQHNYYGSQVTTYVYTITPPQWVRNEGQLNPGQENYLYATFENSDITANVVNNGSVTADVYMIYNQQQNLGSWNPLPYGSPWEVQTENETIIVPETIRFDWNENEVTFIIQDLDGYDPLDYLDNMTIRVTVTRNTF